MKKQLKHAAILTGVSLLISIVYSLFYSDKLLEFINAVSIFAIIFLVFGLFSYLQKDGYFDYMGYSFGKFALIFRRLDPDDPENKKTKEKYQNYHNYKVEVTKNRKPNNFTSIISGVILLITALGLSFIFYM